MRFDYTVAIDGGPQDTFDTAAQAITAAEKVKRNDPDALVTVIIARYGQPI